MLSSKAVVLLSILFVVANAETVMLAGRLYCHNNWNYRDTRIRIIDSYNKTKYRPVMPAISGFFQVLVNVKNLATFKPVLFISHRCDSDKVHYQKVDVFNKQTNYFYFAPGVVILE